MLVTTLVLVFLVTAVSSSDNSTIPLHYDIIIVPNLDSLKFTGDVTIAINVQEEVDSVNLNVKNLLNLKIKVTNLIGSEISVNETEINPASDIFTIRFMSSLSVGWYVLKFTYDGKINENHEGLYISEYKNENSEIRKFALTNFQYGKARQVFPCFDELGYSSTFSISIVRPKDYISLSNVAIKSVKEYDDNSTMDAFGQTDMIPTYLVSFAIIDFEKKSNDKISVYSNGGNKTDLMIDYSSKLFKKLAELYPFKQDKIDQIVVPDKSLPRNVLESAGLIIYRESAVFYNSEEESTEEKHSIVKVVSHAIAKQLSYQEIPSLELDSEYWFHEGTTTFYQYEIASSLEPSWRLLDVFAVKYLQKALRDDVKENAISLSVSESNLENLSEIFFTKAFSLIRMWQNLKLPGETASDSLVDIWSTYSGYPTLKALYEDIYISQIIFTQNSSNPWPIPINLATQDEQNFNDVQFTHVLTEAEEDFNITLRFDTWYIVNKQQIGYYRVDYGDNWNWILITDYLETDNVTIIHPVNRAQLIDDAFSLAENGFLDYSVYFILIKYIRNEEDFIPLYSFFETTTRLKYLLSNSKAQEKFMKFALPLADHLYETVGTNITLLDTDINRLNRIQTLTWLCNFNHENCQKKMFEILAKKENVHPDLQEPVYCGGMQNGTLELFKFIWDKHSESGKARILKSLACTSNYDILRYYLLGTINGTLFIHVNPKYKLDIFLAIIDNNEIGVNVALDICKQFLETILQSFTFDEVSKIFIELSKKLLTKEQENKMDEIISCLSDEDKLKYGKLFETVKKNINVNLEWRNSFLDEIDKWLGKEIQTTTTSTTVTKTTPKVSSTTTTTTTTTTATTAASDTLYKFESGLLCLIMYSMVFYVLP